jgi:nucleotidyltransferase/DNA polymerase involved in DNA repair
VPHWVLHVDMDQFIAAVEMIRRPELRGRPVVVGGDGDPTKRGVVSTASYEARVHGVHSGVPLRTALKRCPDAVFLPVDRDAYEAVSAEVMAALRENGAVVEVLGWDEAFVAAVTDDPEATARDIQHRVHRRTQLHCTVGIGQTRAQAKMATGLGKPAGVYRITDETWFAHFGASPPSTLWGIGPRLATRLEALGLTTVATLASADPETMIVHFGPTIGPWLIRLGQGGDSSVVDGAPRVARSRSRETTFQTDVADWNDVRASVQAMARELMTEIAADGRTAVRVWVKVRYVPFWTQMHSRKLPAPTADPEAFAAAALDVLELFPERRAVRLIGVRAEYGPVGNRGEGT